MTTINTHDTDFYTWTQEQATLLRAGRLTDLDIAGLLEEVEDMGRSEQRELESRLMVLLMHLLKWQYQPEYRGKSWHLTIKEQRKALQQHLRKNPGLKSVRHEALIDAYDLAILSAERETQLPESVFPTACPWRFEQIMEDDFWPEASP